MTTTQAMTECWTEKEIRQQPDMWRQTQASVSPYQAKTAAFLQPLLAMSDLRILLTGAGSSAFIGDTIAPILAKKLQVPVISVSTTDMVSDPTGYLPEHCPLLIVSFARSGSSPESLAALTIAEQRNPRCFHLIVTCNPQGALYQRYHNEKNALILPIPAQTCDRGFAMTSSMSSMMLGCMAAFECEGTDRISVDDLANSVSLLLEQQKNMQSSPLQVAGVKRIIWLGSGCLQGIAHESALKILELTAGKTATFYESPVGFRHGPKSLIDNETQVIILVSNHPYTRSYDLDLLAELRNDAIARNVTAISGQQDAAIEQGDYFYLPNAQHFSDSQLVLGFLIFAQIYAVAQSIHFSFEPDNPSPQGFVNRVVKGVNIYPWHTEQ